MRLLPGNRSLSRIVVGSFAVGVVAVATTGLGATSAHAADPVQSSMTLECQTASFAAYDWAAELSVTAVTDGTDTVVTMQTNDLPGVAPVPLTNAPTAGTIEAVVNGTPVTLTGGGTATAAANAPVALPAVSGELPGTTSPVTVEVTKMQYDLTAFGSTMATKCPPGDATISWVIGDVEVEGVDELPTVTPNPTPSESPSTNPAPTEDPGEEPKDNGKKKGKPAKGTASFSCVLQTLGSPFDYKPTVTMSGSRAAADDSKVTLKLNFSKIPGLAPVPINDNPMEVTAAAKVGGEEVSFSGNATVSAPEYGEVDVPTLTSSIETDEDELSVEITAFKFDFGDIQGLTVYSECEGGGKLSKMTVGVGDMDDDDPADNGNNNDTNDSTTTSPSLPKTGSGSAMLMFGLWASAFVLLGAALFLFLPRRRPTA